MCHNEINAIGTAVAILRRYADVREIPENEAGKVSHYAMLHAQQKGISQDEAYEEIVQRFQTDSWSAAPEPPSTAIHSHLIGLVTDPIPEIGERAENGIAKVTDPDYVSSLHKMVRAALEHNGLGHLSDHVSVHPVEVQTDLPGTSDYLHVVEVAGDPDTLSQITRLWPASIRRL